MSPPLLMLAALAGLLAYGSLLATRVAATVGERTGEPRPRAVGPWLAGRALRRYRELAEADPTLPRLHRSLRLNHLLTALLAAATVVRVLLP